MGVIGCGAGLLDVPVLALDIDVKTLYRIVQSFYVKESGMNDTGMPAAREVIRVGQMEIRYVQAAGNGCDLGCFELRLPPGSNVPPPHSHSSNEELVYVLEGTLRYTVGSETRDLQPGDSMATPRGVVHGFSNPHAVLARALVINTPDIGPQYFREVGSIINADGPPDRARLMAAMKSYGLVPAASPGSSRQ
jgi:mannose-6-phosphate isomerase-like protein (cupin superfamily)